jgi:multiple sugar transport system permease protein
MVPLAAIWIPRFVLFTKLGLDNTPWALIAPALMGTSPFYCMRCRWGFLRVPAEIYEAARLDGAGVLRMWAGIGLPLARGSIAAVAMLAFVVYWSNYLDPLLFIRTPERQTLPFALQMLYQLARSDWPLLMAAATLVTGPVVAVFLLGQRYLLEEVRRIGQAGD